MRLMVKYCLQSLVLAGVIPAMMISVVSNEYAKLNPQSLVPEEAVGSYKITVLGSEEEPEEMELESYVIGVILGEVSPDFHGEALKAQAVAARTYALYCIEILQKHSTGAVCKDYHCCQAFCEPEEFLRKGGTVQQLNKVMDAVGDTSGEILNYNKKLICSTYFASSGGQTEDALEVWGKSYPYLKSVESPGEEDCGYFSKQVSFTSSDFQDALGVCLTGSPSSWFGIVKYTAGGGVDLMRIGGRLYTGTELRNLLKLRSTIMTITAADDKIIIDTKGYGHRVGMSQHGANAMAEDGNDYRKILEHYYSGTLLHQLDAGA